MTLNVMVGDPEEIGSLEEVESYLSRIRTYERSHKCKAGVLVVQRRQFDTLYEIVSEAEAKGELSKPISGAPEFGVKYYQYSYFEAFRQKLLGDDRVNLSAPLRRLY